MTTKLSKTLLGGTAKGALVGAALAVMYAGSAYAGPIHLTLSSGAVTATATGSISPPQPSEVLFSTSNLNGWRVSIDAIGFSPSAVPVALDLSTVHATCVSGGCATDALTITISQADFTTPVPLNGFEQLLHVNQSNGTITQTAWDDTSNTLFGHGTSIGTISVTGTGHATGFGGGPAGPSAYSLTLQDVFSAGSTSFISSDGTIKVPEPMSLTLFGSALVGLGAIRRRRRLRG